MALAWISASSSVEHERYVNTSMVSIHATTKKKQKNQLSINQGSKEARKEGRRIKHTVHVHDSQVSSTNDHALAHDQSQASRAASDDTHLSLERESRQRGVDVHASASGTGDRHRGRQLVLLGVLDGDTIISTGKGAGVGGLVLVLVGGLGTVRGGVDGSNGRSSANRARGVENVVDEGGGVKKGGSTTRARDDSSVATNSTKGCGGSTAAKRHLG